MSKLCEDVIFVDDVTGVQLDKTAAMAARRKEIQFFKDMGVYTKVVRKPKMNIISTKWLDVNKGDEKDRNN